MAIKLPFVDDRYQHTVDPIRRVIEDTARKMACSEYVVAIAFTHLLEGIVNEVSCGECVRIPGFGAFGPYTHVPHKGRDAGVARAWPAFVPNRAFRQEVAGVCSPYPKGADELERYRRTHKSPQRKAIRLGLQRVMKSMQAARDRLEAQAARAGHDTTEWS